MKRMGEFELPEVNLSDAVEMVRDAYRAFGPSFSRESLAGVLKLRGRGGWFAAVIASLRLWGLAEGRGTLRLTTNGLMLASTASAEEESRGRREAVLGVPLLREIAGRSPNAAPGRTDLALMLAEITGADAGRIHSSLVQVRRILADAWPIDRHRLPTGGADTAAGAAIRPGTPEGQKPEDGRPPTFELSFTGGKLSLPETAENLELAAALLRRRAAELSAAPLA